MRHQSIHEPFNFQRMLRGSPGSAWSLMPLNRRGLFTEVWLGRGLQASEGHESSVLGTTNFRTCTWPSSGQDCMTVWPGFIELGSEEKGVPFSQEVPPGTPVDWTSTVFHELGHILGLQDGVVEFVSGAECHWDTDCAWPQRCVGSQCAHSTWQNVPNHVSSMNYYFLHRVDAVGHIDFSSGVRPRVEPFTVVASSCEDPACPDYGDPGCPLPPGRNPPGGKCCLVDGDWPTAPHYCVGPGLREDVGIGNLYDRRGNDYLANRLFQLGEMKCMTNEVGHAQGIGPAPVRLLEQDPGIDWNKNGVEDPTQVGGFVREPGHCYGGQNVHEYVDVNEWDIAWGGGFDHIGVREVPALAVVGTPLCSAIEAVECPPGFECKHGECLPALAPEAVRFSYQCAAE